LPILLIGPESGHPQTASPVAPVSPARPLAVVTAGKICGMVRLQRQSIVYWRLSTSPCFCSTHLVFEFFYSLDLRLLIREWSNFITCVTRARLMPYRRAISARLLTTPPCNSSWNSYARASGCLYPPFQAFWAKCKALEKVPAVVRPGEPPEFRASLRLLEGRLFGLNSGFFEQCTLMTTGDHRSGRSSGSPNSGQVSVATDAVLPP